MDIHDIQDDISRKLKSENIMYDSSGNTETKARFIFPEAGKLEASVEVDNNLLWLQCKTTEREGKKYSDQQDQIESIIKNTLQEKYTEIKSLKVKGRVENYPITLKHERLLAEIADEIRQVVGDLSPKDYGEETLQSICVFASP